MKLWFTIWINEGMVWEEVEWWIFTLCSSKLLKKLIIFGHTFCINTIVIKKKNWRKEIEWWMPWNINAEKQLLRYLSLNSFYLFHYFNLFFLLFLKFSPRHWLISHLTCTEPILILCMPKIRWKDRDEARASLKKDVDPVLLILNVCTS